MPATPLPASGDAPQPKTCDASGMAMIHRVFRAGFGEADDLVRGVRDGDHAHAAVVADQLALLSLGLHTHHEGEDERLWSALEERAPACGGHVARMKEQHLAMIAPLHDLDAALPSWRASASAADAAPLLDAIERVNAALAVHLPDEETTIVPVMETVLTPKEVDWFSEHGRKATPKGQMWNSLGMILSAQPDGGEELLHDELPAPVRLLWRYVGARRYAAHRAALEGR
ncbi:hemerythrin domain-containing protein [Microbacterium hibisci]|uniref:hemerythrin domain-containing protein n=1 Tax=Microbacterium hibisci TaxID=2036000 RepID=UPI0019429F28|nr:hemerythrin domain-containing protein [Microbacterium hibisci]